VRCHNSQDDSMCSVTAQNLRMSLHLQEGALSDHEPFSVQVRFCCPSSLCPSGHWYPIVAPTLKFEPEMVVLTSLSGLPHEEGAANRRRLQTATSVHCLHAPYVACRREIWECQATDKLQLVPQIGTQFPQNWCQRAPVLRQ
jgi:hypothetical protein